MHRLTTNKPFPFCCLLIILFISGPTQADGLSDLQQALKTFRQTSVFKAHVTASVKTANTENEGAAPKEGHTQFYLEKNETGLHLSYPNELLGSIETEATHKKQNPSATTPTTDAMNRFKYQEFSILFNPIRDIEDDLRKAKLLKEESVSFQDKPARLLHLQIPMEALNADERKNLKKYQADLQIWINENGVPLASRSTGKGSGRFALVISFEFQFDVEKTYVIHGDRLLVTTLASSTGSKGAGMHENEIIKANLKLLN